MGDSQVDIHEINILVLNINKFYCEKKLLDKKLILTTYYNWSCKKNPNTKENKKMTIQNETLSTVLNLTERQEQHKKALEKLRKAVFETDSEVIKKLLPLDLRGLLDYTSIIMCGFTTTSGSFVLPLYSQYDCLLRVHYFFETSHDGHFHTHNSDLSSYIVTGGYESKEGVLVEGNEPVSKRVYYPNGTSESIKIGMGSIEVEENTPYKAGEFYSIKKGRYHSLKAQSGTITIVGFFPNPGMISEKEKIDERIVGVIDNPELRNSACRTSVQQQQFVFNELQKAGVILI
jgi:hypothetical protein